MTKKYLENKLTGIASKYDNDVVIKHAELRNIYYGRDKTGVKDKSIHMLKKRYESAENYLKDKVRNKKLSADEKKYITEMATAFTGYDNVLDRRRKSDSYKQKMMQSRTNHMNYTLESIANSITPSRPLVNNIIQQTSPTANRLSGWFKRHYKCAIATLGAFIAGGIIGYYAHNYNPISQPPVNPPKQVQVIPKDEQKPIVKEPKVKKPEIKKQNPVVDEEKKNPKESKEVKQPSLEDQLYEIELKYGTVPISSIEKHVIDHNKHKVLGLNLDDYKVRDEKLKEGISYSLREMYPELVRVFENENIKYMHVRTSDKGLVPALEIEFSSDSREKISESNAGKHSTNYGFLTNMTVINFDDKAVSKESGKIYEISIELEGDARKKAMESLLWIHKCLSNANESKFFHSYWDLRDKHRPAIKGHVIYSDKESDEKFKLRGIVFASDDTKVEVINRSEDIQVGQEEERQSP